MNFKEIFDCRWKKTLVVCLAVVLGLVVLCLAFPALMNGIKIALGLGVLALLVTVLDRLYAGAGVPAANQTQALLQSQHAWHVLADGVCEACRQMYGRGLSVDLLYFSGPYDLGSGFYFSVDSCSSAEDLKTFRFILEKQISRVTTIPTIKVRKAALVNMSPGLVFIPGRIMRFAEFQKILQTRMAGMV